MHAERFLAAHVLMQLDRVFRRAMHGTHDPPRLVRSDRDHADVERPLSFTDLGKDGTGRPVFGDGVARDAAVAGVAAEPDFSARAGLDRPRSPQGVVALTCVCARKSGRLVSMRSDSGRPHDVLTSINERPVNCPWLRVSFKVFAETHESDRHSRVGTGCRRFSGSIRPQIQRLQRIPMPPSNSSEATSPPTNRVR